MKNVKKIVSCVLFCACVFILLAACGNDQTARTSNKQTGVAEVLEAGVAEAQSNAATEETVTEATAVKETESASDQVQAGNSVVTETTQPAEISEEEYDLMTGTEGVDVDLTVLSGTMVYSEVYNMMYTPEEFLGKVVKMNGNFAVYEDEAAGNIYYACIIQDATACCAQGIEFVLEGEYAYPEDYPEIGSEVTVVGTFDTYEEDGYTYCTLRQAELV